MTIPHSILLFAAGLGTRMAPLTDTRPKPLIEVGGTALLDHALAYCDRLNTVVNVHYLGEQIINHLSGHDIAVSDERDRLLETGGGLKKALPLLGSEPVFTMNTDAVWANGDPVRHLAQAWQPERMDGLLLLVPTDRAIGHRGAGDFDMNPDGKIRRGTAFVYTGLQIIRTDELDGIEEPAFSMWRLWDRMLDRGSLFGAVFGGTWCDVGQPESIPIAEHMLKDHADV